ncbi:MAG: DUF6691 family protein [Steroidobacteraceae bacterium]
MNATVAAAFVSGVLFGVGLAISGMTDRFVILGFLDLSGEFNPQLAFVLAGAVAVTAVAFRFVLRMPRPALSAEFRLPPTETVDWRLLLGSAIFGIGWGLVGFCPGPALVGLAGGLRDAMIFVPAMLAGSFVHYLVERRGKIGEE